METFPLLPENVLTTGYSGLQLTTRIEMANKYDECRWIYNNEDPFTIFRFNIVCQNRTVTGRDFVTLCANNSNFVTTSLIVQSPISSQTNASMECTKTLGGNFDTISSITLHVRGKISLLVSKRTC